MKYTEVVKQISKLSPKWQHRIVRRMLVPSKKEVEKRNLRWRKASPEVKLKGFRRLLRFFQHESRKYTTKAAVLQRRIAVAEAKLATKK